MANKKISELPIVSLLSGSGASIIPVVVGSTTNQISAENFSKFMNLYAAQTGSSNTFTANQTFTANVTIGGNLVVSGKLTAEEYHNELVSSSIIYKSGSTKFGDDTNDKHEFTGSVNVNGDVYYNGVLLPNIDANTIGKLQQATSSLQVATASLNTQTGSQDLVNRVISTVTGSINFATASLNTQTGSQDLVNRGISSVTGSINTTTSSFNLEFGKIGSTTASIHFATQSLNTQTGSQNSVNLGISVVTGSLNSQTSSQAGVNLGISVVTGSLNSQTGSQNSINFTISVVTGSINSYTSSNESWKDGVRGEVNGIESYTASLKAVGIVSSSTQISNYYKFAETASANIFYNNQTITGSLKVSTSITASTLKVDGLNYPTADNGAKSFVQTDGAGTLSLQYVQTMYENVRNQESFTLAIGTPLYISGSTGANPHAYVADPGNPLRRPATYVAGENITAGSTGLAIVLGLIEGVNTTGYPAGTEIYLKQGGGWTSTRPTGSQTDIQVLGVVTKEGNGGQGIVLNPGPVDLPNLAEGHLWVGGPNAWPTGSLTTSSFELSGRGIVSSSTQIQNYDVFALNSNLYTSTGSLIGITNGLMAYTSSNESWKSGVRDEINGIEAWTASLDNTYATDAQLYQLYQATASIHSTTSSLNSYTGSNETWKTGVRGEVNGLEAYTASLKSVITINGSDVEFAGKITAQEIHTAFTTSSVLFQSGSTLFGNDYTDTHQFTGSLNVSGSSHTIQNGYVILQQVSQSLNFVDDTAAAAGGVPLGGLYRNGNFIVIRIV